MDGRTDSRNNPLPTPPKNQHKTTQTQLRALLSPAQADAALRVAEMGWLFRRVQAFAERGTSTTTSNNSGTGSSVAGVGMKKGLGGSSSGGLLPGGRSRVGVGGGAGRAGAGYGAQYQQQRAPPLGLVGQALCFVLQVRQGGKCSRSTGRDRSCNHN